MGRKKRILNGEGQPNANNCHHCEGTGGHFGKSCGTCDGTGSELVRKQLQEVYNAKK